MTETHCRCGAPATRTETTRRDAGLPHGQMPDGEHGISTDSLVHSRTTTADPASTGRVGRLITASQSAKGVHPISTTAPDQIPDAVVAAAANRPAKRYPGVVSRTTAAAVEEPQRGGARA